MKTFIAKVRFWFYMNVKHPIRVRLLRLTWVPLWWLRKYVPRDQLSGTPADTIRLMAERLRYVEQKNVDYLKAWSDTEADLRRERMARVSDKLTPDQKKWAVDKMGVQFRGSEEN